MEGIDDEAHQRGVYTLVEERFECTYNASARQREDLPFGEELNVEQWSVVNPLSNSWDIDSQCGRLG